ncbi:MAG: serpin family protein [Clostridiales bacterium]|nr:serpin family protein [Clostridiales bacterium]
MIKKIGAAAMAAVMFVAVISGCKFDPANKVTEEPTQNIQLLKTSEGEKVFEDLENLSYKETLQEADYNKFVFNFASSCSTDPDENVLVSPASLLFALELVGSGADGNTLDELSQVLVPGATNEKALAFVVDYYNELVSKNPDVFKVANASYISSDISDRIYEDYLNFIEEKFDSEVHVTEFNSGTVEEINGWVSDKTDGMIKKLLTELNPETVMVLLNAIAFEGKWETPYEDHQVVEDSEFVNSKGETEKVTMLYSTEGIYFETDKATGFMKYYEGEEFAFLAMLPKDDSISANEFMSSLTARDYREFLESKAYTDVFTMIPEFSYDYSNEEITHILKSLGINDAFDPEKADFSHVTPSQVFISRIIQKTHIELDREGTKAAAATAVLVDGATAAFDPTPVKEVYLDRPFVYMIVDTATETPAFIGTLNSVEG